MKAINSMFLYLLEKTNTLSLYSLAKYGPLKEDGWFRSFKEKSSVDAEGNPIPWFTYPATEFLTRRIHPEMKVFEYGCGASTLWWSKKVNEIVAVEHVEDWYNKIAPLVPENVSLHYINLEYKGIYSKKIKEYNNRFDVVVLDGRDRINCAMNSLTALKEDGIIVWDNSDRQKYEAGYHFLYKNGFRKIEFVGLVPIINFKSETGIFYRQKNCLGI